MGRVRLLDFLGYVVGKPDVPTPFPNVILWGEEFFIADVADLRIKIENPRYYMTTGFVVADTRDSNHGF
jgi:hypothetical protein